MEKINKLNSELKVVYSDMQDKRLEGILEVRGILSPEQFAKFKGFTEKHSGGMKRGHMGKRPMKEEGDE